MDFDDIERILELVREHDLAEFELEREGLKLRVRKNLDRCGARRAHGPAPAPQPAPLPPGPVRHQPPPVAAAPPAAAALEADDTVELAVVKSPIVGTFYRSSEPGAPSFVDVGDRVKKDQVLCIIEAMKLMNEIKAEYEGEIVSVYVENGKPVQYGERLFAIKTDVAGMFKKILIANRGEIALRVICACRELGIKTVAVYSEADENSLHVRFADEDVCIGPARSADSYLNVPAVHQRRRDHRRRRDPSRLRLPVRERLPRRGLRGLPHQVHRPDAERDPAARRQGAGAPGDEEGRRADPARQRRSGRQRGEGARRSRSELGYPVIIKAVAGGGGRGMRVIRAAGGAVEGAQDRAARSGSGVRRRRRLHREVRREPAPHRVPGARRSSRQRRPPRRARVLDPAAPSEAARRGAVGRRSPRRCGASWAARSSTRPARCSTPTPAPSSSCSTTRATSIFLEVNTRLQVEHPVTEFITGIDIVKEQIRIAAGERLVVQAGRRDVHRPLDRVPGQRRGSGDVRAVARA